MACRSGQAVGATRGWLVLGEIGCVVMWMLGITRALGGFIEPVKKCGDGQQQRALRRVGCENPGLYQEYGIRICAIEMAKSRPHWPVQLFFLSFIVAVLALGCGDNQTDPDYVDADSGHHADGAGMGWPDVGPVDDVVETTDLGPVSQPDTIPDDLSDVPFVSTGSCEDGTVRFATIRPWPGGGVQVLAMLRTPEGDPVTAIAAESIAITSATGGAWSAATAPAFKDPAIIGILLDESADPQRRLTQKAAISSLVSRLAPSDLVVLWRTGSPLELLSDLTSDKGHLTRALATVSEKAISVDAAKIWTATKLLGQELLPFGPENRWLVIVSDSLPPASGLPTGPFALGSVWLGSSESASGPHHPFLLGTDGSASGQQVAEWLHQQRFGAHRIGACVDVGSGASLSLQIGDTTCSFAMPEPMEHMSEVPCSPEMAAADDYPFGDEVVLELTPEEKAIWDQYHQDRNIDDMTLKIRIGPSEAINAVAHFRGQTSLDCVRKSLSVNLKGSDKRRVAPFAAGDEFYLISMCKDDGYFNQVFADVLMRKMGIFPLGFRYVRLFLNGENQGVYLLLGDAADSLVDRMVQPATVLRRRFDPEDEPVDVKYPNDTAGMAVAAGQYALLVETVFTTPAESLLETLSARMDFDGYLRWLAFNALFYNGDFVDEAYFYASREAQGAWYFRFMGWDADDLFSSCHHGGKWALPDPNGLLYCAEADLDVALIRSNAVYARYVEWIGYLAQNDLAQPVIEQVMGEVRAELFAVLNDDETATAMVELHSYGEEAKTAAGAQTIIATLMDEMLVKALERRAKLLQKIEAYGVSL